MNVLHAIECDCQECLDKWMKVEEPASPSKCLCIHALDGYETYKIDNNTIGVRLIWFDVKHNLPKKAGVYWVAYELCGRLKSHYCLWEEKSRKYQGNKWGWRSREAVRRENIKFWMEIPKPPCQADEKLNSEK